MKPTIAESLKFALGAGAMVAAMAYITSVGGAVAAEANTANAKINPKINPKVSTKTNSTLAR